MHSIDCHNVVLLKPTREIPRRRRVRYPFGAQCVQENLIVTRRKLDILQAHAAKQHVVGDIQYVIDLPDRAHASSAAPPPRRSPRSGPATGHQVNRTDTPLAQPRVFSANS